MNREPPCPKVQNKPATELSKVKEKSVSIGQSGGHIRATVLMLSAPDSDDL